MTNMRFISCEEQNFYPYYPFPIRTGIGLLYFTNINCWRGRLYGSVLKYLIGGFNTLASDGSSWEIIKDFWVASLVLTSLIGVWTHIVQMIVFIHELGWGAWPTVNSNHSSNFVGID